jgi:hypothetical protein
MTGGEGPAGGDQTLAAAVEAGIADGTMLPDMPPSTIAHVTLTIMDGLQLQWLAGEGRPDMAGDFDAYIAHLKTHLGSSERLTANFGWPAPAVTPCLGWAA